MADGGSGLSTGGVALVAFLSALVAFGTAADLGWFASLQGLTVPIIAMFGVWIAARQMLIADEKVSLDRFNSEYERRFAVYEATRAILEQFFRAKMSQEDLRSYGLRVLEAKFLFDDDMYKYLKEIEHHISMWLSITWGTPEDLSEEEKLKYRNMALGHFNWLKDQGSEGEIGVRIFEPFLKYAAPSRPWLLRWP